MGDSVMFNLKLNLVWCKFCMHKVVSFRGSLLESGEFVLQLRSTHPQTVSSKGYPIHNHLTECSSTQRIVPWTNRQCSNRSDTITDGLFLFTDTTFAQRFVLGLNSLVVVVYDYYCSSMVAWHGFCVGDQLQLQSIVYHDLQPSHRIKNVEVRR